LRAAHNPAVRVFLTLIRRGFAAPSGPNQSHNPKRVSLAVMREFRRRRAKTGRQRLHKPCLSANGSIAGARHEKSEGVADARDTACVRRVSLSERNRKPHGRAVSQPWGSSGARTTVFESSRNANRDSSICRQAERAETSRFPSVGALRTNSLAEWRFRNLDLEAAPVPPLLGLSAELLTGICPEALAATVAWRSEPIARNSLFRPLKSCPAMCDAASFRLRITKDS
jgi:hypothetical protein